jgi:predicted PhzF superfamily epimerase YddE/YHI9
MAEPDMARRGGAVAATRGQRFQLYDAFGSRPGEGNPAAVLLVDGWPAEAAMRAVAGELNAWTAFVVGAAGRYAVRVFSIPPIVENELCGHALLAAARALFEGPEPGAGELLLQARGGPVAAWRTADGAAIDFPAIAIEPTAAPPWAGLLGGRPRAWWRRVAGYPAFVALYDSEAELAALPADPLALRGIEALMLATAPGSAADFASRLFAPMKSLLEDPAGGTQHALAAPFWAARLGRAELSGVARSPRGGRCRCRVEGGRVRIAAPVTLAAEGRLLLPLR